MKDVSWTLEGWPAVPMFLLVAVTPVLTALIMSLPVTWLVNHLFAVNVIHAIFGVAHLGYWRVVGLFALWFAMGFKVAVHGPSK